MQRFYKWLMVDKEESPYGLRDGNEEDKDVT